MKWKYSALVRSSLSLALEPSGVQGHLKALKAHHRPSWAHSLRVAALATDIAAEVLDDPTALVTVARGGALHDIGKAHTDIDVLTKPGPLNPSELQEIRGHTRRGFLALDDLFDDRVRYIAAAHHEFKIGPYPRKGTDRRRTSRTNPGRRSPPDPLTCRMTEIVAVADIFDALTSARSYKKALPLPEVHQILNEHYTGDALLIDCVLERATASR